MSVFLFSIGCELGNTDSCLSLNAPSQIESNLSKNKSRTDEPSYNSCNESEAESCFSLGMMYYRGDGVRKDHFKAIEYFRKACDLSNEAGCKNYATLKNQGVR